MKIRIAALAVLLTVVPLRAEEESSANFLLPYCHRLVEEDRSRGANDTFLQGYCLGSVDSLGVGGTLHHDLCIPESVTRQQMVRVVVAYLDSHPSELHKNFDLLAFGALMQAWPCKK
jgi:hypothetical protein